MGRVILGMPGPWAKNFHERSDHYTTKIGGLPDWPISDTDIKPELLKCVLCGERLCLLAQIYAPIPTPKSDVNERVIYVFGCLMAKCGSDPRCWRALRVQKCNGGLLYGNCEGSKPSTSFNLEEEGLVNGKGVSFEENLVCANESIEEAHYDLEFDELARQISEVSFEAFQLKKPKSSLSLKVPKQNMQSKQTVNDLNSSIPVVACFYMYLQEDQSLGDVATTVTNHAKLLNGRGDDFSIDHGDEEVWEREEYEYDMAIGAGRTYLKFKKRMDAYPEQCFRYSYGGKPLLATHELEEPIPCILCGSPRQYEMQLMPPLLYFLHEVPNGFSACRPKEWNWTTLLVYTCSNNCCQNSSTNELGSCCWAVAEETVIVQEDEFSYSCKF